MPTKLVLSLVSVMMWTAPKPKVPRSRYFYVVMPTES